MFKYKSSLLFIGFTLLSITSFAQTYCLTYKLVKNTNTLDITLGLIASGNTFRLGTGNLQFKYKSAALSTPTLLSNALVATGNYNGINVTTPTSMSLEGTGDALISFNYNFSGITGNGLPIMMANNGTNIAVIRFNILDARLSPVIRPYDNGSMGTVVFDDNTAAPTLLATSGNCPIYDLVIPLQWLSIKAYQTPTPVSQKPTVTVDWATASEKNNSHFIVERSKTGLIYDSIGTVKAANRATNYSFIDVKPIHGLNYYHIRQIDLDGTENISKTDSVLLKPTKLHIYPTLTLDFLTIETEDKSDYRVINALGQQVLVGKSATQIDVSSLSQGTYILKIGEEQVKFTKLAL